ncbi:type II toxin-antitoxin system RelE family toxin [Vulcanisaeta sp. JCM 14467]|uniref:type II toxin-antitoxin system RelE family toxin n=1 Tax=Vulcanisaeta sp. JCM 14467 TaxID=1295370 RepID=UPI000A6D6EE1|nr:type II toxin-antitoxin system RelE/ParE family toxin [Vulcanisaeta sp. JCM 14467]
MSEYSVRFTRKAKKTLDNLPNDVRNRILARINELIINPICEKRLKGRLERLCRMRIGDYRVVYLIDHENQVVVIIDIGKRENIYDRL